MDDDSVKIAQDEQGRVLKRIAIEEELVIGGIQILMLALVLPAEEAPLPDIREPVTAAMLGNAALKAEGVARGVKFYRGRMADQTAEVDEMFLGGRTLLQFDLPPLGYKIACRHRFANPFRSTCQTSISSISNTWDKCCVQSIISIPWMKVEKQP